MYLQGNPKCHIFAHSSLQGLYICFYSRFKFGYMHFCSDTVDLLSFIVTLGHISSKRDGFYFLIHVMRKYCFRNFENVKISSVFGILKYFANALLSRKWSHFKDKKIIYPKQFFVRDVNGFSKIGQNAILSVCMYVCALFLNYFKNGCNDFL